MNFDGIDYDDIMESELMSNVNDDSDVLYNEDNPEIPENLLKIKPLRYEYLFAITGR